MTPLRRHSNTSQSVTERCNILSWAWGTKTTRELSLAKRLMCACSWTFDMQWTDSVAPIKFVAFSIGNDLL